ncbi:MAG TPA: ABC transporter ATP-binding protein, partial [Actinotalea sp.]|nr:ABC transporter ATP-binding protein [Actinotalea sp.]
MPAAGGRTARRTLLEPLTCTLTERRVAVIGANGSGKSTLARLVNG